MPFPAALLLYTPVLHPLPALNTLFTPLTPTWAMDSGKTLKTSRKTHLHAKPLAPLQRRLRKCGRLGLVVTA